MEYYKQKDQKKNNVNLHFLGILYLVTQIGFLTFFQIVGMVYFVNNFIINKENVAKTSYHSFHKLKFKLYSRYYLIIIDMKDKN